MKQSYTNPAWQNLIKLIAKKVATEVSCISNQTAFGYATTQPEYFADACALHVAVKNASN